LRKPHGRACGQIVLVLVLEGAFFTALPNHPEINFRMTLQDFIESKTFEHEDEDDDDKKFLNATADIRSEKDRLHGERFARNGLDSYNQPPGLPQLRSG
jgi:hypothetical protein